MHGKKTAMKKDRPGMGAEDFAAFLQEVPGAMFLLGIRNKKIGADKPWHHPEFKIDEKAIPLGASVLAAAVMEYFERKGMLSEIRLRRIGLPDSFQNHARREEQLAACGLDAAGLAGTALDFLARYVAKATP